MRLRTFTAASMPLAMKMVREEMGEDAIIVSSEPMGEKRSVSVTAVVQRADEPSLNGTQDRADIDQLRFEMQNILRYHNLPELFVAKLLQKMPENEMTSAVALHRLGGHMDQRHLYRLALEKLIHAFFDFDPLPLHSAKMRLMLVGTPGIGKTLTIAKLAALLASDGTPLTVITTDNRRAGGIEQLEAFTTILGLKLHVATNQLELAKCLKTDPNARVLIDTAGCNPYDTDELKELAGYASLEHIEPVLVVPSGGDCMEAIDAAEAFMPLNVRRLLITRADATKRFGNVLAVAAAHNLAFCQISNSASIIDSLHEADAPHLAQLLLRYQLQS